MVDLEQQVTEVVKLRDENDLTFAEIGRRLGFSESTAKRRYKAGVLLEVEDDFPETDEVVIPDNLTFLPEDRGPIERFNPLERFGDAVVTMDFHVPLHDPKLINTMLRCADKEQIGNLIIAGDYFNMEVFSSFLPYQPEASLQQERYDGNLVMRQLLKYFDEVDFIVGNHDFRLVKKLGYKKSFEECMQWMLSGLSDSEMNRINFSDLDFMHYYPQGEFDRMFRVCHPRNFSSNPLTIGRKLATKHNCSIISGHCHHFAIGAAQNGYDLVIEGGGFYSKERTEYIQKTTGHHEWVQGFTFFKNGVPSLVGPLFGNHLHY